MLLAALGVFLAPLLGRQVPYYRDLLRTYYPVRQYLAERLSSGELPQWYPYENLGEPYLGQVVTGTFHVLSALYLVLPLQPALKIELALSYAAALLGAFLLARSLGVSRTGALVCGFAFGFCGYSLSMSNNLPYLRGIATLPWVPWALGRALQEERARWRWVAVTALVWASVVLGGDLQGALLAGLFALLMAWIRQGIRGLVPAAVAAGLALMISCAELLPAYFVRGESIRSATARSVIGFDWALFPGRIPEMVMAGFIPDSVRSAVIHFLFKGGTATWAVSIFSGSVVLAAAVVAAVRARAARPWIILAAVGVWLAVGSWGGLHTAARAVLPLLNSFRFPEKYLMVTALALALGAGMGADALWLSGRRSPAPWVFGAAVTLAATTAALRFSPVVDLIARARVPADGVGAIAAALRTAWVGAAAEAAAMLVGLGLLCVLGEHKARVRLLLPALVFVQLWRGNGDQIPTVDGALLAREPLFCSVAHGVGAGLGHGRLFPLARRFPPSSPSEGGERWVAAMRNLMEPDVGGLCRLETLGYNLPGLPVRVRELFGFKSLDASPYLAAFDVPLVVRDAVAHEGTVLAEIPSPAYQLVHVPSRSRVYLAAPRWVGTAKEALAAVRAQPEQAAVHPILEGAVGDSARRASLQEPGEAQVINYRPEHVVVRVKAREPAALVLNDQFYPGWTARVDGKAATIYPANYLARAVLVEAGEHTVEFEYQTRGLVAGALLSLSGVVVSVGLLLWGRRRDRTGAVLP